MVQKVIVQYLHDGIKMLNRIDFRLNFFYFNFFVEVCRFCFCIYVCSKYYYVCMYGTYVHTYVKFNNPQNCTTNKNELTGSKIFK